MSFALDHPTPGLLLSWLFIISSSIPSVYPSAVVPSPYYTLHPFTSLICCVFQSMSFVSGWYSLAVSAGNSPPHTANPKGRRVYWTVKVCRNTPMLHRTSALYVRTASSPVACLRLSLWTVFVSNWVVSGACSYSTRGVLLSLLGLCSRCRLARIALMFVEDCDYISICCLQEEVVPTFCDDLPRATLILRAVRVIELSQLPSVSGALRTVKHR